MLQFFVQQFKIKFLKMCSIISGEKLLHTSLAVGFLVFREH